MKIAVMGAGAIGSYFGGLLARSGEDVWFVARGPHLKAMREKGLRIESPYGDFSIPVQATDDPAEVGPVDLVLFTVKSFDTESAARQMLPMMGPQAVVLSLQNGVTNEEVLGRVIGPDKVLGGLCYIPADVPEPGVVKHGGPKRDIIFGELSGGITERARAILAVLEKAGIPTTLAEDIRVPVWSKFLFISAFSSITALTRMPIGPVRDTPETWELYAGLLDECYLVARGLGVNLPDNAVAQTLEMSKNWPDSAKSSLLQDLEKGKRLEIDALCGAVARLGARVGVPTPLSKCVYGALKVHQPKTAS